MRGHPGSPRRRRRRLESNQQCQNRLADHSNHADHFISRHPPLIEDEPPQSAGRGRNEFYLARGAPSQFSQFSVRIQYNSAIHELRTDAILKPEDQDAAMRPGGIGSQKDAYR